MKKIKEINLSVGTRQPDYPGTQTRIFNDYSGGQINNADSSFSRRMQTVYKKESEDEESEDEESEEEEMILSKRKKKNGKYSLLETLEKLSEKPKSTKKYDDHPALKGGQSKLPDALQKGIIKKSGSKVDEIDEDSFEEFDLEEMVGGYTLPLGKSNKPASKQKDHHRMYEEEKIKEQIERMRILEAYHQKTSNRLK